MYKDIDDIREDFHLILRNFRSVIIADAGKNSGMTERGSAEVRNSKESILFWMFPVLNFRAIRVPVFQAYIGEARGDSP
jgi:hypothetical protein